jgi:hypothetical protein
VVIPISVLLQVFAKVCQLVVVLKLKEVDQDVVVLLLVFVENSTLVVVFLFVLKNTKNSVGLEVFQLVVVFVDLLVLK